MLRAVMKKNIAVVILFLSLVQGKQPISVRPKIVNGIEATIKEVPYQVSLQLWGRHICGGSILSRTYIITAAHCVNGKKPVSLKVSVGTDNNRETNQVGQPQKIIVHEGYTPLLFHKNDIALIQLKNPLSYSDRVQPVILPNFHEKTPAKSKAIVSGWGRLGGSSNGIPDKLQKAQIWITDQLDCMKAMSERKYPIYPSQICANDPTTRRGHCSGDSGGPLTVNGTLVGIVSWSVKDPSCASTKYPGVYTRVSEYIDWIIDNAV